MVRRLLFGVLALVVVVLAGGASYLWLKSEAVLHHRYPLTPEPAFPRGPDAVARGEHLAAVYGCSDCHGADLHGRELRHPQPFEAVRSANLTLKARTYSDADFARVVREGIMPSGWSVEFMPSDAFVHMDDADLGAIVAYIRSKPAGGADLPEWKVGLKARLAMALGMFPPDRELVLKAKSIQPRDMGPEFSIGRHLVSNACTECHGYDLKGGMAGPGTKGPPDLAVASAYSDDDFSRLMKTGVAAGNRQLVLMSPTARARFSHFSDDEIKAIHAYLVARAKAGE